MDDSSQDYHISFFKPTTPQATANRNLVIWLVLIWFVAIFGFHILLRIVEEPTPEPAYLTFQNAWETMENGSPVGLYFKYAASLCERLPTPFFANISIIVVVDTSSFWAISLADFPFL